MSSETGLATRMALGAAAGFAGTAVLQALMLSGKKWMPQDAPPLRQDPGEFMVEQAEKAALDADTRAAIPEAAEKGAAMSLGIGYGCAFGALYGALRGSGDAPLLAEGIALGLGTWAAAYLGWLPAVGLMPPVKEHRPLQIAGPILQHVAYGVATAAAYHRLREMVADGQETKIGSLKWPLAPT